MNFSFVSRVCCAMKAKGTKITRRSVNAKVGFYMVEPVTYSRQTLRVLPDPVKDVEDILGPAAQAVGEYGKHYHTDNEHGDYWLRIVERFDGRAWKGST
jgi:hypothetical protein